MEVRKEGRAPVCSHDLTLYYIRFAFWIVLVCALGFLAINQGFQFFYGAHLLKAPCDLCAELNPGVQECIDNFNKPRPSFYVGGNGGGWSDPFSPYTINISLEE